MKKQHLCFSKWALCFALSLGLGFTSCKDDKNYDDDINRINTELASLKTAITALQKTYVSSIKSNDDGKTLTVTLSDGTTQTLTFSGTPGTASIVTIGSNGNWFIDGVDTGKSSKGDKGETGATGGTGAGSVVTIGSNGNWFIDGVDTGQTSKPTNGTGTATGSTSVTVVQNNTDGYFLLRVTTDGATTEYKLPMATTLVTSIELIPTTVSSVADPVKMIGFPVIVKDYYPGRYYFWNTTPNSSALVQNPANFPFNASVSYRINPASVDSKAFEVQGFDLKTATAIRSFTPNSNFTITNTSYSNGELNLSVAAKTLPSTGSTSKVDLASFVVKNKDITNTDVEDAYVYSEYVPVKTIQYAADLVKAKTAATPTYTGETYQILHPNMTEAEVALYDPLQDLPATTLAGSLPNPAFLPAITEVRNFTLAYNAGGLDSKGKVIPKLVLADTLDGIFGIDPAVSGTHIPSQYFEDNKAQFGNYTWKFEPVKFEREGVDHTARYLTIEDQNAGVNSRGIISTTKILDNTGTMIYQDASIDRILVVRASLYAESDTNQSKPVLQRIVVIHVVKEEVKENAVIDAGEFVLLLPGCVAQGELDVDQIYNNSNVNLGKDKFNQAYTLFTVNQVKNLSDGSIFPGTINITDARLASNLMIVTNPGILTPGVKYEISGTFSGTGVADVKVVWYFTVNTPTLYLTRAVGQTIGSTIYPNNWQGLNIQVTGRDSKTFTTTKWDESNILSQSFVDFYPNPAGYTLQKYDNGGKVVNGVIPNIVAGNCGAKEISLQFEFLDRLDYTKTLTNVHERINNYFIFDENGLFRGMKNGSELYYSYAGRSFVDRKTYPVQAVAYVDGFPTVKLPLRFPNENGIDGTNLAKFNVQHKNPVQPIVGYSVSSTPVKGDVYFVDKRGINSTVGQTHYADLSKLFSIKDFHGLYVYNKGAVLDATQTDVDDQKWATALVNNYRVGHVLSSDSGDDIAMPSAGYTSHGFKAKYEILTNVNNYTFIIDQKSGMATIKDNGQDLQSPIMVQIRITVPNQWNWGEFKDPNDFDGKDKNTYLNNTYNYISTVVTVPIVPVANDPDPSN